MEKITNINQLDLNKLYTYADYLTWQFQERVELIRGKIFKMSPAPKRVHQEVSRQLQYFIFHFFHKTDCKAFNAPFDVRLFKKTKKDQEIETVVQPDICVICDREKLDDRGCIGAPDLIVEILSPSTKNKDIKDKFELYEQNEVKEYWIVDPSNKTVIKYTLEHGKYIGDKIRGEEEMLSSTLFPELSINLSEVFEE